MHTYQTKETKYYDNRLHLKKKEMSHEATSPLTVRFSVELRKNYIAEPEAAPCILTSTFSVRPA
jgi:hypothetical protein